jgi:peroxiredoxin
MTTSTPCCTDPNYKVDGNFTICTHCGNTKQIAFSTMEQTIDASEMKVVLTPLPAIFAPTISVQHPENTHAK